MRARDSLLKLREQQVAVREQALDVRERELNAREHTLDSVQRANAPGVIDSSLLGDWEARMTCTQTSCAGSAIGDIRSERWTIGYEGDSLYIAAHQKKLLSRVYYGRFDGATIAAHWVGDSADVRMDVILSRIGEAALRGTRTIDHFQAGCQIIFAVELNRP
jgi:hypothetical protein